MSDTMVATHTASMNLRFVEREVHEPCGVDQTWAYRTVRVLQQMMVPKDWSKHEEFWLDVKCFKERELTPNAAHEPRRHGD